MMSPELSAFYVVAIVSGVFISAYLGVWGRTK